MDYSAYIFYLFDITVSFVLPSDLPMLPYHRTMPIRSQGPFLFPFILKLLLVLFFTLTEAPILAPSAAYVQTPLASHLTVLTSSVSRPASTILPLSRLTATFLIQRVIPPF